ncbi:hypothetical protein D3C80_2121350 [compost metagenome]
MIANCAAVAIDIVIQIARVPRAAAKVSEAPWMLRMKKRWKISITTSVFIAMVCAWASG